MSRKQKIVRLPVDLSLRVEADAKQKNLSENDYIINALQHILECDNLAKMPQMKLIVLKYPSTCKKCGDHIPAHTWALYGRGYGAICMDCYIDRIGDKTIIAKHLKVRELTRLKKALESEVERLSQEVDIYALADRIKKINEVATETNKVVMDYFKEGIGTDKEKENLEEVLRATKKQFEVLHYIEDLLFLQLKKRKKEKVPVDA